MIGAGTSALVGGLANGLASESWSGFVEGAANGFMWGAITGAISGGVGGISSNIKNSMSVGFGKHLAFQLPANMAISTGGYIIESLANGDEITIHGTIFSLIVGATSGLFFQIGPIKAAILGFGLEVVSNLEGFTKWWDKLWDNWWNKSNKFITTKATKMRIVY